MARSSGTPDDPSVQPCSGDRASARQVPVDRDRDHSQEPSALAGLELLRGSIPICAYEDSVFPVCSGLTRVSVSTLTRTCSNTASQ